MKLNHWSFVLSISS